MWPPNQQSEMDEPICAQFAIAAVSYEDKDLRGRQEVQLSFHCP